MLLQNVYYLLMLCLAVIVILGGDAAIMVVIQLPCLLRTVILLCGPQVHRCVACASLEGTTTTRRSHGDALLHGENQGLQARQPVLLVGAV